MDLLHLTCLITSHSAMKPVLTFVVGLTILPSSELTGMKTVFIRILPKGVNSYVMILNPSPLYKVSKNTFLFDPLVIPFLEYVTIMGENYSPKSELAVQTYATIGLITISTVTTLSAHVVLKQSALCYSTFLSSQQNISHN